MKLNTLLKTSLSLPIIMAPTIVLTNCANNSIQINQRNFITDGWVYYTPSNIKITFDQTTYQINVSETLNFKANTKYTITIDIDKINNIEVAGCYFFTYNNESKVLEEYEDLVNNLKEASMTYNNQSDNYSAKAVEDDCLIGFYKGTGEMASFTTGTIKLDFSFKNDINTVVPLLLGDK